MKIPVRSVRVEGQDGIVSLSVVDECGSAKLNLVKRLVRDGTLVFDDQARRLIVAIIEAYQKRVPMAAGCDDATDTVKKIAYPYAINFDELRMEQHERGN